MFQTERLKTLRKKRKMTQAAVAEQINVTREAYSMYETGHRQPSCQSLAALSVYFHVSTDYLIGLSDDPTPLGDLNTAQLYLLHVLPYLDDLSSEFLSSSIQFRYPQLNPITEIEFSQQEKSVYTLRCQNGPSPIDKTQEPGGKDTI